MKFLKVLINCLISGAFFCFLLSLLTIDLNINLRFDLAFFTQLSLFLFITYGLLVSLICFILFFIVQFFAGRKFNIAVVSPSFLTLSFSFLLFLFLLIFKTNQHYFLSFFDLQTQKILNSQSTPLMIMAVLGFITFYGFFRYKKNALFYGLYFFLLLATLIYAVNRRFLYSFPFNPPKTASLEAKQIDKKITVVGLKGLSFDFLIPLINEGKLPNFSWFMENGSWGKLKSFSPTEPLILHTSFNTGKLPAKHRQISPYRYRLFNVSTPLEITPRFIFFWQLTRTELIRISANTFSPLTKDLWQILGENKTLFLKRDNPDYLQLTHPSPKAQKLFHQFYKELEYEKGSLFEILKQAFYGDVEYEETTHLQKKDTQPQVTHFYLSGLNMVETYFYKYSFPDLFGNIDQEEINKYSTTIEKYYQFYDQIIGKYLASLKEDELLVIYSPHGIEALPMWKRIVEWILGNAEISAYHEHAPHGVIFFYGKEIERGKNIKGMKLVDIVPTFLNYLGLPVGKDMDGTVQSSVFVEEFRMENPVLYISSYEEISIERPE
ncbi:MAG: alkaline phosphatase family protein [Candidatus Aminicenantes bacterium]